VCELLYNGSNPIIKVFCMAARAGYTEAFIVQKSAPVPVECLPFSSLLRRNFVASLLVQFSEPVDNRPSMRSEKGQFLPFLAPRKDNLQTVCIPQAA
jgi:hypothetical protein